MGLESVKKIPQIDDQVEPHLSDLQTAILPSVKRNLDGSAISYSERHMNNRRFLPLFRATNHRAASRRLRTNISFRRMHSSTNALLYPLLPSALISPTIISTVTELNKLVELCATAEPSTSKITSNPPPISGKMNRCLSL